VSPLPSAKVAHVVWPRAYRIIRSRFPPISLFEDIADPSDWDAIARAEMKTNPRFEESVGKLSLVEPGRRLAGSGASYVMAAFTHVSTDRQSRFSDGAYGVYYAGDSFEVAVAETIHHHERFMRATEQLAGWTSQFRELVGAVDARLHDLRPEVFAPCLEPNDYTVSQAVGRELRASGSDGVVYPSVRQPGGSCIGAFHPDVVGLPTQGRHLAYHWDGRRVDQIQDLNARRVFAVT
jgi:hypothetical protein